MGPYGPVEVSFDIKQENLTQILEPHPSNLPQEELEKRLDSVAADSLLLLSGSPATVKTLDTLLARNKAISKILHPKTLGALARRKAQEFAIQAEPFNQENLEDAGMVDGAPLRMPSQVKNSSKLVILTSIHYDPMYGLSSAASDLISLVPELKSLPSRDQSTSFHARPRRFQTLPGTQSEHFSRARGQILSRLLKKPARVYSTSFTVT